MEDHRCFECVTCGMISAFVAGENTDDTYLVLCPDCGTEWCETAKGLEAIEVFV